MNHISTQALQLRESMGRMGTLVPSPHVGLVLGLVQGGGGCQEYLTRFLPHGAHRPAGNMEPSWGERWEKPGSKKGSEVRTQE